MTTGQFTGSVLRSLCLSTDSEKKNSSSTSEYGHVVLCHRRKLVQFLVDLCVRYSDRTALLRKWEGLACLCLKTPDSPALPHLVP